MDAVLCFIIFTNERSSHWGCSVKKCFYWKTPVLESLFNEVSDLQTLQYR